MPVCSARHRPGADFWHASGLVILPQPAARGPAPAKAMPALAGWGYCVSLVRSLAGTGLAEPIEEDIDPGSTVRVRWANGSGSVQPMRGFETTMEVKKMNVLGKAMLAAICSAGLAVGATPAPAQTTLRAVMHSDLKIVDPIWTT